MQVKCPTLSLSPATFTVAAKAAVSAAGKILGSSLTYLSVLEHRVWSKESVLLTGATINSDTSTTAFDPYTVEDHFWLAAFIFEDVSFLYPPLVRKPPIQRAVLMCRLVSLLTREQQGSSICPSGESSCCFSAVHHLSHLLKVIQQFW